MMSHSLVEMQLAALPRVPDVPDGHIRGGFTHEGAASASVEHYTPAWLFEALCVVFDLDPCHPEGTPLPWVPARRVLTRREDGLASPWLPGENVWLNPPYNEPERACRPGCGKKRCVRRGYHLEADDPGTIAWVAKLAAHGRGIALLFSRTDVEWFHKHAVTATAWCFIRKRVSFVGRDGRPHRDAFGRPGSPGAGSILLAWGEDNATELERSGLGIIVVPRKAAKEAS